MAEGDENIPLLSEQRRKERDLKAENELQSKVTTSEQIERRPSNNSLQEIQIANIQMVPSNNSLQEIQIQNFEELLDVMKNNNQEEEYRKTALVFKVTTEKETEKFFIVTDCVYSANKIEFIVFHNTSQESSCCRSCSKNHTYSDVPTYRLDNCEVDDNLARSEDAKNEKDVSSELFNFENNLIFKPKFYKESDIFEINRQIDCIIDGQFHEIDKDKQPNICKILNVEAITKMPKNTSLMFILFMSFTVSIAAWLVPYSYVKILIAALGFQEAGLGLPENCTSKIGHNAIIEAKHAIQWATNIPDIKRLNNAEFLIKQLENTLDNSETCKVAKHHMCDGVFKTCLFSLSVSIAVEITIIYSLTLFQTQPNSCKMFADRKIMFAFLFNTLAVGFGGVAQLFISPIAPSFSFGLISFLASLFFRFWHKWCNFQKCKKKVCCQTDQWSYKHSWCEATHYIGCIIIYLVILIFMGGIIVFASLFVFVENDHFFFENMYKFSETICSRF